MACPPKSSRQSEQAERASNKLKPQMLRQEPLPQSPSSPIITVGREKGLREPARGDADGHHGASSRKPIRSANRASVQPGIHCCVQISISSSCRSRFLRQSSRASSPASAGSSVIRSRIAVSEWPNLPAALRRGAKLKPSMAAFGRLSATPASAIRAANPGRQCPAANFRRPYLIR